MSGDRNEPERGGKQRATAKAAAALGVALGRPQEEIAAEVGVTTRTIRNWSKRPGFRRMVSRFRDKLVDESVGRMAAMLTRADEKLMTLLDTADGRLFLDVVKAIHDLQSTGRQNTELIARLEELEARLRPAEMPT